MKKMFGAVAAVLFAVVTLGFVSCQSTKVSYAGEEEFDYSEKGGATLDGYWEKYFETGDTAYVEKVIAYTECQDLVLQYTEQAYNQGYLNDELLDYLDIDRSGKKFTCKYDLDFLTAICLHDGDDDTKSTMILLYCLFPEDLLIRNAVKASAFWSLGSLYDQDEGVREYLSGRLDGLSEKTRNSLRDFYGVE